MPLLSVSCLSKQFPTAAGRAGLPVVNGLSFEVEDGELFALLGPSGCGKTTSLRCVAGIERPDRGTVTLDGRVLDGDGAWVPPERRGVGLVFQDYALFPHLSVLGHVLFGLQGVPRAQRRARADEVLRLVGLSGLEDRLPHALSGGQQQRVAIARAIAPRPRLLLLDEPFSNLDALLRTETRERLRELVRSQGMTALLVTHDQEEALSFADRVAVMQSGRIDQVGTPQEVYGAPRTLFVAQFLGQTNLLLTEAQGPTSRTPLGTLQLSRPATGTVMVSVRPEHLALASEGADGVPGVVLTREYRGHDVTYRVRLEGEGGTEYLVHTDSRALHEVGAAVRVRAVEPAVVLDRAGGG